MVGLHIAIVLLLIVLNGLLAMSELAIVSARTSRLQQRAQAGNKGARIALELAEDPNKFLSSVQIGITLIGIVNGAFGGATLSEPFAGLLARIPGLESSANRVSGIAVVLVITYLSLIIGELVPKQLALQRAEKFASMLAPALKWLATISAPIVWFLGVSSDLALKILRADQVDEPVVTEEEVKLLLRQATESGIFEEREEDLITGVFGLGDRNVGEIMTPRHQVTFIDLSDPDETNINRIAETGHAMFPVCEESTDNVVGVITTRDLWKHQHENDSMSLREIMRPALFVPEISPVLTVLEQMRDARTEMGVVIDEYGGVEGILTLGDVLEDLVDELGARTDIDQIEGATRRDDGTWLLDGAFPAHEARERFGIKEFEGEEAGRFETIGGYILDQLGHIPVAGEKVASDGFSIEVVDMDGHRIDKVLLVPPPPTLDDEIEVAE